MTRQRLASLGLRAFSQTWEYKHAYEQEPVCDATAVCRMLSQRAFSQTWEQTASETSSIAMLRVT